ncbi:MAG: Holliday junction branch migration protein RuvA [Deltaproteobacteria bacterium]|nr:Holliday junction branch migration protein RuvA [Deltaproteobacteria bacterium]MBI2501468.1 Holliday junction branch migration protein RuvA [Deltaproteobacteria bacterium]
MIASLSGLLQQKENQEVVINVSGVGYRVAVSKGTLTHLPPPGEKISLLIHTAVREDDISLFGFLTDAEKKLFQKLIKVSGIGPKLAITILSGIAPQELARALQEENLVRLTSIPGIGKKTAERMIVDLKDKLADLGGDGTTSPAYRGEKRQLYEETLSALLNLGYARPMAEKTVSQLKFPEGIPLENCVKEALKILSERRV